MLLAELLDLLRVYLNLRIRRGDFTERGLARRVGISQPHLHNVLKGARAMSTETADLILRRLGLSILDLLPPDAAAPRKGPAVAEDPAPYRRTLSR
jgi:transcriptional regulator with XRE-family HTH domain